MSNNSSNLPVPLLFILKGFSPVLEHQEVYINPNAFYRVDINILPIPELALYVLVNKLNCTHYCREEKLHWGVCFFYEDKNYALEYRKYGLRLVGSSSTPTEEEANKILSALAKATRYVEREVRELAQQRISEGRITVINKLAEYSRTFDFFRNKAEESYTYLIEQNNLKENPDNSDKELDTLAILSEVQKEASYYAWAAVEAFYSRLEHILILIRPFVEPRLKNDEILKFMADGWGDKFKQTFFPENNQQANQIFSSLNQIKEKYRNPSAHGGFVKKGAALYFHDSLMTAQPVMLLKKNELPVLTPCGIKNNHFAEILQNFDEFELFLRNSEARYGYKYARCGLDVAYDDVSIDEYLQFSTSDEDFDNYIESVQDYLDDVNNADY